MLAAEGSPRPIGGGFMGTSALAGGGFTGGPAGGRPVALAGSFTAAGGGGAAWEGTLSRGGGGAA